jgi:hypothetical protein
VIRVPLYNWPIPRIYILSIYYHYSMNFINFRHYFIYFRHYFGNFISKKFLNFFENFEYLKKNFPNFFVYFKLNFGIQIRVLGSFWKGLYFIFILFYLCPIVPVFSPLVPVFSPLTYYRWYLMFFNNFFLLK